eukprot:CAMPEP_0179464476 /NCGR_PEP_ID=MMETSP0799-20121207/46282_1 /TAXON_ID=46947 /ORGANISM="Geminigera cryophila, Strain CCMP2564" /LENGTH=125 /DNA_ID=CAMNT_0021268277 /DNA_START=39 /DNA_END=413 /DNA_ORIENTATION=-
MNFARRNECNRCGTSRPYTPGAPAGGGGRGRGQKQLNPEQARCERPGQGRGPPIPKEGDWHCTMCMNLNWARRDTCNVCQTGKPDSKEDRREGRAGGHYERQEKATKSRKERDDSDEEYDEFGRK